MATSTYYDTNISSTVRHTLSRKLYRISVRRDVPYITYKRKTRVLYKALVKGAYINVENVRIYFE